MAHQVYKVYKECIRAEVRFGYMAGAAAVLGCLTAAGIVSGVLPDDKAEQLVDFVSTYTLTSVTAIFGIIALIVLTVAIKTLKAKIIPIFALGALVACAGIGGGPLAAFAVACLAGVTIYTDVL